MESRTFHRQHGLGSSLGAPDPERLNRHGGAIALGHPVGMTGTRLILTLCHQLHEEPGFGLASLCIGGGQGGAVLIGSEP